MPGRLVVLATILVLAACAGRDPAGGWRHALLPEARWAVDYTACRRAAEDYVLPRGTEVGGGPLGDYDRAELKRRADRRAAGCMAEKGYERSP